MDFNIYVLGDVRLFADTFNAIAMMFTVANGQSFSLWASNNNSMGLGMGAFLGALLALCILVYNAAFRQKFDIKSIIVPLLLYIILTVPKVTVNVVDAYYRDGAQSVDNVPLGLALPMSAISSIAFAATQSLEDIFSVPNASFTKITEDGFVMPLKLLHSMRYTGLTMQDAYPNVTASLVEISKICLTNNNSFNMKDYQNSIDSLGIFYSAVTNSAVSNRMVKIYPSSTPSGYLTTCAIAGNYIRSTIQNYINGSLGSGGHSLISSSDVKIRNFRNDLQKILAANNANTGGNNLSAATLSPQRILDDIQALTTAGNDEALRFAQATLLNEQLSSVSACMDTANTANTSRCFAYTSSLEQWKEKSAAEASGFISIMRDGQNLLILLSVTLFPIMVLIIVLQGMGGLKVVMSYLLYTISAYMWIPVAAMINWYVQVQLNDEMEKWRLSIPSGTSTAQAYLSLANAPLFYDAISKKLALANSVMASVPMICMGLFSGMLMTMNRLADKMNPQTGYDATANTPSAVSRDSLATVGSSVSYDSLNAVGQQSGLAQATTMKSAAQVSQAIANMQNNSNQESAQLAKLFSSDVFKDLSTSKQTEFAESFLDKLGFSKNNTNSFSQMAQSVRQQMEKYAEVDSLSHIQGMSHAEQEHKLRALAGTVGMSFEAGMPIPKMQAALKAEIGATTLDTIMQNFSDDHNFTKMSETTGTRLDGQTAQHMTTESKTQAFERGISSAFKDMVTRSQGTSDKQSNSEAYTQARSIINQTQESNSRDLSTAFEFKATASEIVNANNATNGRIGSELQALSSSLGPEFENNVNKIKASGEITSHRGDTAALDLLARQVAIAQTGDTNLIAQSNGIIAGGFVSPVQHNLASIDNSDVSKIVNDNVSGVPSAVHNARNLNPNNVIQDATRIEGKANQNRANVEGGVNQTPFNALANVGNAAVDVKNEGEQKYNGIQDKLNQRPNAGETVYTAQTGHEEAVDAALKHDNYRAEQERKIANAPDPSEEKGLWNKTVAFLENVGARQGGDSPYAERLALRDYAYNSSNKTELNVGVVQEDGSIDNKGTIPLSQARKEGLEYNVGTENTQKFDNAEKSLTEKGQILRNKNLDD